jgi:tetratricopeptide (TPR) repeat protein
MSDTSAALATLAGQVLHQAMGSSDPGALAAAVHLQREVLAATPPDHPDRHGRLYNLSVVLRVQYERTGSTDNLDEAIEVGRAALAATPAEHPNHVLCLTNLGAALQDRYMRTGDKADLDEAIEIDRAALAVAPAEHPFRGGILSYLALALRVRYGFAGALADLDEAVKVGRAALAATPAGHLNHAGEVANLAGTLLTLYERTGNKADLDEAIEIDRAALAVAPADHPFRGGILSILGLALRDRYDLIGALADLDEAVEVSRAAVAAAPPGHPDRAGELANLGIALVTRFERTGVAADLDEAVEVSRAAVDAAPLGHPDRARHLSSLAGILRTRFENRFERTGVAADLDEAVEVSRAAVAATPVDHPERAVRLSNLGLILRMRSFERTGVAADLDEAVEVSRAAVDATPLDHPDRARHLLNLVLALGAMHKRSEIRELVEEAVKAGRAAVAVETAPASMRAQAARAWGHVAAAGGDWQAAAEGYAAAIGLLPRVAPARSLGRSDQEFWLAELASPGAEAAACCLQAGAKERAVELWEQGCGVLLGQALDTTDLTRLAKQHPDLAAEFIQLRDELDSIADLGLVAPTAGFAAGPASPGPPGGAGGKIDRRRQLADNFERVVARIRAQPGFERFQLPLPVGALLAAADHGPLVLVNVTNIRSDALLLRAEGVQVVPLPALTPQATRDQVLRFASVLDDLDSRDPDRWARAERELARILGWLWDTITGPVLERLGLTGRPGVNAAAGGGWPRLWWCPSGLLTFLPLHAAGHHDTRFDAVPKTVIDRVVSSYTPTVRALTYARRSDPTGPREHMPTLASPLLVVTMPQTPAASDLPGAAEEGTMLKNKFPGQTTLLSGKEATHDSVSKALLSSRWAHFACHASSDLTNPSASYLLLHDHQRRPLTAVDVARLRLDDAELAFLSACSTVRPGGELPDEALHLASAFQLTGYRHVIGTLWRINDMAAVDLADDLYAAVASAGTVDTAAAALHTVTLRLRNRWAQRPSVWASHIHSGA